MRQTRRSSSTVGTDFLRRPSVGGARGFGGGGGSGGGGEGCGGRGIENSSYVVEEEEKESEEDEVNPRNPRARRGSRHVQVAWQRCVCDPLHGVMKMAKRGWG